MRISNKDLIEYLEQQTDWKEGEEIASHFGVSVKSVFNYIKRINDYQTDLIISSNKGYRLNRELPYDKSSQFFNDSLSGRINYVLRLLLVGSNNEVDLYSIADSLYVSDSYVESLLRYIRNTLSKYSLTLKRKRNKIWIIGDEINKRRLISSLITREKADNLMSKATQYYNDSIDMNALQKLMVKLFQKYSVYVNDYGFSTILVYLSVTINRIKNNKTISTFDGESDIPSLDYNNFLIDVKNSLEREFQISLPKHEYYYLSLIIKNNCTAYDLGKINIDNIRSYIDAKIVDESLTAIYELEKQYHLDQFDDTFKIKIILHMHMLKERMGQQYVQSNPMAQRIKNSYPFIYDMATFLVKELFSNNIEKIPDEEISFLAIHIGAYLDQSITSNSKLKVCFVYADYHHYYEPLVGNIFDHFKEDLNIVSRVSIKYTEDIPKDIDCIITNYPLAINYNLPVFVLDDLMIQTGDYIHEMTPFIKHLVNEKKRSQFKSSLEKFMVNDFFFRDLELNGSESIIRFLCLQANKTGYARRDFFDEVMERETLSSTSYDSSVAIPHSLYQNCTKSFISVVINDKALSWDDKDVNLVMLIGVRPEDNRDFQIILNTLIPFLTSKVNVQKLLSCYSYNELINCIVDNIFND